MFFLVRYDIAISVFKQSGDGSGFGSKKGEGHPFLSLFYSFFSLVFVSLEFLFNCY
jgi:hypothetical protein